MSVSADQVIVEIGLPPEVSVAMKMIGLEGDKLAGEMRRATAIDLFRNGLLSIGKAAELADLCLADFMDVLVKAGVVVAEYSIADLQTDGTAFERFAK